jgi:hypothetical protein
MVVLEQYVINHVTLEQLHCTFPKLTEANQQYVLGVAEGLRYAQDKERGIPEKRSLQARGQREIK